MRVVQMRVDTEDLAETGADIMQKALGKPCALSEPVAPCEAGKRSIDGCWTCRDRSLGGGCVDTARGVGR